MSQVKAPIQKDGFHHSHLLGKTVWGHQVLSTMVSCIGHNPNYDIYLYDKEHGSKIDYITQLSESLPTLPHMGYALFDAWFTCPKVIDAYTSKGYPCIWCH
ncbi:hypothetical protein AN1V17_02260 [Vallitalea sediminicola]